MKNLYEILEISLEATPLEIKMAYRKLALKWHPDRVPEEEKEAAGERFKEMSRAYSILKDYSKKAYYDKFGCIEDEPIVLTEVLQKFKEDLGSLRQLEEEEQIPSYENIKKMEGKVTATCYVCKGTGIEEKAKGFLIMEEKCKNCDGTGYVVLWDIPKKPLNEVKQRTADFFSRFKFLG